MYTGLTAKLTVGKTENGTTYDETIGYISNWSVEETRDTVEVTQLGEKNKEVCPMLYSWTASADGTADFADEHGQKALRAAMIEGTKLKVKFFLSETDHLVGEAYVTSFSTDISSEDKGNVSISLTGTGELAFEKSAAVKPTAPSQNV